MSNPVVSMHKVQSLTHGLVIVVLALLVLSVYGRVGGYLFVGFDDSLYVYKNAEVQKGLTKGGIGWAFTTFHASNWHPLTWLSHMADVELFGITTGWHHWVNVLFHLLNTVMLFLVLSWMTGGIWQSAFVAALFAVHPLHVESVAWIAERKDVLSTLFWILTMGAYLRYVRRPCVGRYLPVIILFTLGLMCKPMLVTLPFVLLLLDWWPLGRMTSEDSSNFPSLRGSIFMIFRLIWEKVPLLGLSAISAIITFLAQSSGEAVEPLDSLPLQWRIPNALVSYVTYLWKIVWPSSLAVFYPHPASTQAGIPLWTIVGGILLLGGFSFIVLWQRHRHPYLAVGWLWYLGTLVPVIGLVQVGNQAMADRYTYIPLIGLFIVIAWGIPNLFPRGRFRRLILGMLGGSVVVALSVVAWNQAGYWRDSVTLFSRAVTVTKNNWLAWNNLGAAYDKLGQPRQAILYYREALRIKPNFAMAWNNLGLAYHALGQDEQALSCYQEALKFKPDYIDAWNNLGVTFNNLGQSQQAINYYREALRIKPDYADAWNNLGAAYDKLGQPEQAINYYREALRIKPDYADAWNNLGAAYDKLGRPEQAIIHYQEVLKLKPDYADAWYNLGVAYDKLGQPQQAIFHYRRALQIKPDSVEAWFYLGIVYAKNGQFQQAISCFEEALRIKPDFREAQYNLGLAYDNLRKLK
jgi:tetratricopeptide (TPR) repeat protein